MMMREQPPTVTNCVTTMQCVNMPVTDCVTMQWNLSLLAVNRIDANALLECLRY